MAANLMSELEIKRTIDLAIELCLKRIDSFGGNQMYILIEKQLKYIKLCIEDKSISRSKLHEVNIGMLAVRELGQDTEFSQSLQDAFYIVHYMKSGLKVPAIE